jgi:vacuolar protein sorting-associated protein 45
MSAPRGQASDKEKSEALAQMNLTKIARAYLQQVIDEGGGFKALLLDQDTMRACSMLYGRTELAEHNVVHIEKLEANDGKEHSELKVLTCMPDTPQPIAN